MTVVRGPTAVAATTADGSSRRRLALGWPEALIVAAVAAAYLPTLTGASHIPYDAEFYHYPLLREIQKLLFAGTLPTWDPSTYGGTPLLANSQSAWLYLPQLLTDAILAALRRPLTEHTLDVLAVAHLAVAGVAIAAVARNRNLGRAGAAYAGVFVVLNGETIAQAQHILMTYTLAWLSLAILLIDLLARRITPPRVIGVGVLFALMLTAGFVPLIPACVVLMLGVATFRRIGRRRAVIGTTGGLAIGALLAAAMLLPTVLLLGAYQPPSPHSSLPSAGLLTAVLPNVFGQWLPTLAGYTGPGNATETYYFIGAAGLILIPVALTSGRDALYEGVLTLVLLLASFGAIGNSIAAAVQGLPIVGPLWRPEDVLFVAMVPLGLLLGRGLAQAASWQRLAVAALMLVGLAAVPLMANHLPHHLFGSAPTSMVVAMILVGLLLLIAATVPGDSRLGVMSLGAVAVIGAAELAAAAHGRYFVNASGPATTAGPKSDGYGSSVLSVLRAKLMPGERVGADIERLPAEWLGFPPIWGLPDANGYQPQLSKYQLRRVEAAGEVLGERTFVITPSLQAYFAETDTKYVVVDAQTDQFARVHGYSLIYRDGIYHVYRILQPLERAYAVTPACVRRRGPYGLIGCRTAKRIQVHIEGPSVRRLVTPNGGGVPLLITGEIWYPGWHAASSAGALPVSRTGYLASVSVPPGVSSITLSYSPPGLVAGAIISTASLGACGIALALTRRRRLSTQPRRSEAATAQ